MEASSCLDSSWLAEVPKISRIELHEAAKLLPQLLFTEESGDDMNEEEYRTGSPVENFSCQSKVDNPKPSLASNLTEEQVEVTGSVSTTTRASIENKTMNTPSEKPNNVPLIPSVFSTEIIPQHQFKPPPHYGLIPDISVVQDDDDLQRSTDPFEDTHPESPLVNFRVNGVATAERKSSIPKLPQIPASHKPHALFSRPQRVRHHSHSPTHHSSLLGPPDDTQKPTVPLQLQNIRQQLKTPIEDMSKAIHPAGMVGGVFSSRQRRLTHPGYMRRGEQPLSLTPTAMPYRVAVPKKPEFHSFIDNALPSTAISDSMKPTAIAPYDYLRKTSRKVVLFQPESHEVRKLKVMERAAQVETREEEEEEEEEENIAAELKDEVHDLVETEISSEEKEERKKNILRQATILHLNDEKTKDCEYIVNFSKDGLDRKTKNIINKFRGGVISRMEHLTDEIRDDYDQFLSEVDAVTFYAHRQAEELLSNYSPPIVLIISSSVPKAELLQSATRPEVLSLIYDFGMESYASLSRAIKALLDSYMVGAKSKSLAFVCKGGPGYMYLLQKKPITPAKLLKEGDLLKFWKEIGCSMSKVSLSEPSVVHLIESNVAGNRQGIELLSNLEAAMFTHRVKVFSPLELEPKGREMINTYFFPEKFKMWKSRRYSKVRLFK